ncbi:MarR family winged helix-turn-helix transcriptional regulator [Hamadaea tsunoensis]|uniref:MarR family winged helix-turn-helix transcriptional regulator n=1 Tax=Hamadaea tsunoensis TaxID=53368 RepID=UPI000406449D|nr:MarR family transcriptional regulator [Hamadaea tsunoensis]
MEGIPERLAAKPSWLITQLATHARRLSAAGHEDARAGAYHYRILAALREFGAQSQADLGRRGNLDRSDVVAALNELAASGCIERTPDPADRRRNLVRLTDAGVDQLHRMDRSLDRVQDELLGPLSADERATLTGLLTRLLAHHRTS